MRALVLSSLVLTAVILVLAGCSTTYRSHPGATAYWSRSGATLDQLASEARACYAAAVASDYPSALPATQPNTPGGRLLPPTEPPPKLWTRSPREAAFERFDEQQHYDRCMRERGWTPTRA